MRRPGMNHHQMEWTSPILILSFIRRSTQPKTAPLKSFHITKEIILGTMSSGSILP